MLELQVSPGLALPGDLITQTVALLAARRGGKSNAAAVMAEEMFDAGQPWVGIDPKGDWWGLRSSADGAGPGLPIPVFGGLHGDMPLLPESGRLIAELVVEHNLTCILDVSRFSKAARIRFLTDFAERLYELHQADPQPRHLFLEEAHVYLPQRVMADQARCVGAWTQIVTMGGSFGLGITIISQRAATVNKDVLTQVEALIVLRTTSPQDRKAVRDWMEHHAIATEIVDSLPGLASGEAWVSSGYWLPLHGHPPIQRFRFRQRRTFDSGATPTVGERRRATSIADIDLGVLQARMAAVVDQAEQNNPATLRRRITDLERKLAAAAAGDTTALRAENDQLRADLAAALARPPQIAPVFGTGDIEALQEAASRIEAAVDGARALADRLQQPAAPPAASNQVAKLEPAPRPARSAPPRLSAAERGEDRRQHEERTRQADVPSLGKAERALLGVLAQFPQGRTRVQLALLSHYSVKSSSISNALGALRSAGLATRGEPIRITPEGLAAIDGAYEPLPTGDALVDHWMHELSKAERAMLRCLLDVYPASMTRDELAAATDYSPTSSSVSNALGRLRSLDLVSRGLDIRADDSFAREVGL